MKTQIFIALLLLVATSLLIFSGCEEKEKEEGIWIFLSFPCYYNFDVPYPEPGWEGTLNWYLNQIKSENPFVLYLAHYAPHDPLQAPEETIEKYEGVYEQGYEAIAKARYEKQREMGLFNERYPKSEPVYPAWDSLSDSAKSDQILSMQVYAAMIDRMDQNIGRVIDQIKSMGKWENTLFMFASDNGASAEE